MRTQIAVRAMGIRKSLHSRFINLKELEEIGRGASPEEAGRAVDRWLACQPCPPGKMADWSDGLYRRDEACPKCGSTASSVAINGAIRQWWCQSCGVPFMPPDSAKIARATVSTIVESPRAPKGSAVTVIKPPPDGVCEMCGLEDELRPYGPGGMWICFDCGMLDEEGTARRFEEMLEARRRAAGWTKPSRSGGKVGQAATRGGASPSVADPAGHRTKGRRIQAAFVHCHECGWGQDDFWGEDYNPAKYLATWNEQLIGPERARLDEPFTDDAGFIRERGNLTVRETLAQEYESFADRIRNMEWITHEDFQADPDKACPRCGSGLCID